MKTATKTIRKILNRLIVTIFVCASIFTSSLAHADYYNLGTLDVAPVNNANGENQNWLTESLAPGQTKTEKIRISNFSEKTVKVALYATDAESTESNGFFAKNLLQKSDDIAGWIRLPADTLTLEKGQTKIVSANISLPKNAGVGLHTAAIMVKDITESRDSISFEKGVRVYLNVTGTAIAKSSTTDLFLTQSGNQITANIQTVNNGTVDYKTTYTLEIKNVFGGVTASESTEPVDVRVKPGTETVTSVSAEKPSFGLYTITLKTANQSIDLGPILFIPLWAILFIFAAALIFARKQLKNISLPAFPKFTFNKLAFQKSVVYLVIFAFTAASSTYFLSLSSSPAIAQPFKNSVASSYILTVKLGNFRGLHRSSKTTKDWDIKLSFPNATIRTQEYLNFEPTDRAEIVDNSTAIKIINTTGPDNDGLVLNITPSAAEIPNVIYENLKTGEKYTFPITDYISAPGIYPDTFHAIYFKADLGPESMLSELATEMDATPELEATPPPVANIPELENLFLEDLPATPELLADFILNSDYVDKISADHQTRQVKTDAILIDALSATPEVLAEVAATPDLNFIFIPTENIVFEAQEFSFDETKTATEDLGTLIFVQNKDVPWNTYVSTTDFTSTNGKFVIPASSLTITPGEFKILDDKDGAIINAGSARTFKGRFDKTTLVTVEPGTADNQVFVMNPTLQIKVPPGTLPGHYRGTLTITSL